MSKQLLTAGCSWTDPNFISNDDSLSDTDRGGWPMWPELVANRLNLQCINKGKVGASNDYIFNQVVDTILKEKNIKLVVVMWSGWDRFTYLDQFIHPLSYFIAHNFNKLKSTVNIDSPKFYDFCDFFFKMDQKDILKYTKRTIDNTLRLYNNGWYLDKNSNLMEV